MRNTQRSIRAHGFERGPYIASSGLCQSPDRTSCHRHKHNISHRPKLGPELLFRSVSICAHSLSNYGWRCTLLAARLVVLVLRQHPDPQDSHRRSPWSVHSCRCMQVSPCQTDFFKALKDLFCSVPKTNGTSFFVSRRSGSDSVAN